ncbi:uncharacterized protein BDR25DRAFT_87449, partial [Lindgomyces ingoldianus]
TDRPRHSRAGGLFSTPIFFEEFLVFTSGFQGPRSTIPSCSEQSSDLCLSQVNSCDSSFHRERTESHSNHHGSESTSGLIDQALSYSDPLSNIEPSLDPSSVSFSTSSLSMTDTLLDTSPESFFQTTDWSAPSCSQSVGLTSFPIHDEAGPGVIGGVQSSHPFVPSYAAPNHLSTTPIGVGNLYNPGSIQFTGKDDPHNSGPSPASPETRNSSSSEGSSSTPKLSTRPRVTQPIDSARVEKRRQNTLAARRYRQKRVDQMTSLESALKETQSERDALKVRVARLEGEVETLRHLLRS